MSLQSPTRFADGRAYTLNGNMFSRRASWEEIIASWPFRFGFLAVAHGVPGNFDLAADPAFGEVKGWNSVNYERGRHLAIICKVTPATVERWALPGGGWDPAALRLVKKAWNARAIL